MKKQFMVLALLASASSAVHADGCLKHLSRSLETSVSELGVLRDTLGDYKKQESFVRCDQCEKQVILDIENSVDQTREIISYALEVIKGKACQMKQVGPQIAVAAGGPPIAVGAGAPPPPPMPNFGGPRLAPGTPPPSAFGTASSSGAAAVPAQGGMSGGLLAALRAGTTLRKTESTSSLSDASTASSGNVSPAPSSGKTSPVGGFDPSQISAVKLKPTTTAASGASSSKPKASDMQSELASRLKARNASDATSSAAQQVAPAAPAASAQEDSGRELTFAEKMAKFRK